MAASSILSAMSGGRLNNQQVQALLPFVGSILNVIPLVMADRARKIREAITNPPPPELSATFRTSGLQDVLIGRRNAALSKADLTGKSSRQGAGRFGGGLPRRISASSAGGGGGGGSSGKEFGAAGTLGTGIEASLGGRSNFDSSVPLAGGIRMGSPTAAAATRTRASQLVGTTGTGLDPMAAFDAWLQGG